MTPSKLIVSALLLTSASLAFAIVPKELPGRLEDRVRRVAPITVEVVDTTDDGASRAAFDAFASDVGGTWWGRLDARTGRAVLVSGSGLALPPGLASDLDSIEARVRALVARHPALLAPEIGDLTLSLQRSQVLDGGRIVFVDFDIAIGGRKAKGARVFARLNHGRVIQFGTEMLGASADPAAPALDAADAYTRLFEHAGGRSELDSLFGEAELAYLPVASADGGVHYRLVWEVAFRRHGEIETWTARVDAHDGSIVEFFDQNHYEGAVDGGVFPRTVVDAEVVLPFPFVNVTGAGATDSAGQFAFSGGVVSTGLDGPYFNTNCEGCTSPSQALASTDLGLGLLRLGVGGADQAGNGFSTPAERNSFFHLSLVRLLATKWLSISWLNTNIRSNVNIADTCNAFYNGTVNFYRAGGGCNNTGEIADVMQHEWGHGIDNNTRGGDSATGEGTADHVAFLFQRDPVIGPYFRTSGAGVRDLDHRTNTRGLLTRSNVGSKCPPGGSCPGALGYECHCEGEIYGQAGWDLSLALIDKHGFQTGWLEHERIFFRSLPQAGGYLSTAAGAIYDAYLAVDDDDGNLANGTPNGGQIYAAFNTHGIAGTPATSSPGCARPAEPVVTATSDCSGITLSWPAVPGAVEYRVMKNWLGPERAFLPAGTVTTNGFVDDEVRPGIVYHYVVQAITASGCGSTIENVTTLSGPNRPVLDAFDLSFDDVPAGNRSGTIDPGESVDLFLTLRNVANVAATSLLGTLSTTTPGVTVEIAEQPFADSAGLDTTSNASGFRIALDQTVACGSFVDLSLTVSDDSGCAAPSQRVRLRVGVEEVRLADTFATNLGWTYDAATSTATAGAWTRGVPDATGFQPGSDSGDDGALAWFTAPNAGGDGTDDVDGGQVVLLSPIFDLSAYPSAQISYQRWFANRDLGEDAEDFYWVEASSNGGATWSTVERLGTNDSAASWTRVAFDLASITALTSNMRFRVRVSDGTLDGNLIEGAFDDFRITEAECDETPPCFAPPTFAGIENAAAANECGETVLGWQAASTNCQNAAISYSVYRSVSADFDPSPETLVASGLSALSYDDALLVPGVAYHYIVRADDTRSGQDTNLQRLEVIAPATPDTTPPLFDGLSSVTSGAGCGETVLAWQAARESCGAPVVYRVYRSTSAGFTPVPENLVAETTDLSLIEAGLSPNTTYHYVVRALDQNGLEDANVARGTARATVLDEVLALENFESGAAGWARSGTNNATSGLWELGDPAQTDAQPGTCPSGAACWATGLSGPGLGDNDIDGGTTTLLSGRFSLAGLVEPAVRYRRYYSNNTGGAPGLDTWTVEISDDDGASWATLESTQTSDEGLVFREIERPIAGLADATATMRLRFTASDLGDGSVVEAVLDDFETVDLAGGCDACGAAPVVGTIFVTKESDDVLLDWSADPVAAGRFKIYTLGGASFADATLLGTSASKGYRHQDGALYQQLTAYVVSAVDACGQEGALR